MAKQKNQAPKWAPDAVPTVRGWADPKTGEILVSQRGLKDPVEDFEFRRDRGMGRKDVDSQMPEAEVSEIAQKAPEAPVVEETVEAPAESNEVVEEVLTEQVADEAPSEEKPAPKKKAAPKRKPRRKKTS